MATETNSEKSSASGSSLHEDIITAIHRAKNPKIDPLKDPKTVEPIGQIAQIMAHDNYDRDNRLTGKISDTEDVHGWKRIDRIQKDNSSVDSLSMSLWKKGDAVVATVLSVAGPGEAVRNKLGPQPESYAQGKAQIAQWKGQHPGLVLVGHGDRGQPSLCMKQSRRICQRLPLHLIPES